uniref:Uncharacterized protein n=1 Tax=Oryza nivara TaxID=4536 RepID=A0A0E0IZW6_ORYNI
MTGSAPPATTSWFTSGMCFKTIVFRFQESRRNWPLHPDRAEAKRSPAAVMDDDWQCPSLGCDLPRVGIVLDK